MNTNNMNDAFEIDIKSLIDLILRKFWIIFLASISLALGAFLFSKFVITPTYQSTTKVYILNKEQQNSAITFNDLQTGTQLTKDYMTLITGRPVLEQVIAQLNLNLKYEQLAGMITVQNPMDTRLLNITVAYKDPFMAKQIADAVRDISSKHIREVMNIEEVNKAEDANIPEDPSSPNILMNTILGGLVGGIIAVGIILFVNMMDDTLKTPDDIEKYLGISVLSSIPVQNGDAGKKKKKK
jgi:Capsular polysaccharide biosynthesis protein